MDFQTRVSGFLDYLPSLVVFFLKGVCHYWINITISIEQQHDKLPQTLVTLLQTLGEAWAPNCFVKCCPESELWGKGVLKLRESPSSVYCYFVLSP